MADAGILDFYTCSFALRRQSSPSHLPYEDIKNWGSRMNWDAIGAVGEILGAFGVVASLAYLAIQIRKSDQTARANEKATRSATASDVARSLSSWYSNLGLEEVGGTIFRKGMRDPESLTEEQQADFLYLIHGAMLLYQNAFVLGQEGTLDSSLQAVTLGTISAVIDQPGFQLYWRQRQSVFTKSFQDYIEELDSQDDSKLSELYD